jgi:hypothetical protein
MSPSEQERALHYVDAAGAFVERAFEAADSLVAFVKTRVDVGEVVRRDVARRGKIVQTNQNITRVVGSARNRVGMTELPEQHRVAGGECGGRFERGQSTR